MRPLLPLICALLCTGALFAFGASRSLKDLNLRGDSSSLSLQVGGTQTLSVDAGVQYAGYRYMIVGSGSGTFPGTTYAGLQVPLNFDKYSQGMLENPGQSVYQDFRGYLDAEGKAEGKLNLPAKYMSGQVGAVYHHAALLIDPKTKYIVAATNPVELLLLP